MSQLKLHFGGRKKKKRAKTSHKKKGKRFLNKKRVTRGYRMKHGYEITKRRRKAKSGDEGLLAVAAIGALAFL